MKNGWSKTHGLPLVSAGVRRSYWIPSMATPTDPGAESTRNVWTASASAAPRGSVYVPVSGLPPEYPGPCRLPCTVPGSRPTFSITSISPLFGQPTEPMLSPSIQNAGHIPCPRGILMLASNRPYACVNRPLVSSRAEGYWQLPYQQPYPAGFSRRAVITRWPLPSSAALLVLSV